MIIYKITNKANGKVYIGQTVKSLAARWKRHCWDAEPGHKNSHLPLQQDISKFGPSAFTVEQIDIACTREELDEKERYWIGFYESKQPKGYNYYCGGNGYIPTEEALNKCRGNNHWTHKKAVSQETKARMSAAQQGAKSNNHKACKCMETSETFPCVRAAARKYGLQECHIHEVCKGHRKRCGKLHWIYISDDEVIHNKE